MGRCDRLAITRTQLANKRTFLSYLRTSVLFFATGITMLKLMSENDKLIFFLSIALILAGFVTIIAGVYVYIKIKSKIN